MTLAPPVFTTIAADGTPTETPDASANALALKALFQEIAQRDVADGDPASILLDLFAYGYTLSQWETIEAARQTLLEYATGTNLEHIGQPFGVTRLPASKARVTLTFTANDPLPSPRFVATGTRLRSATERLLFETIESGTLPAGVAGAEIFLIAECIVSGDRGNVPADSVTEFLSPVPGVTVTNAIAATGGTEPETDDALRVRIPQAIEAAAPGSAEGYAAIAYQVDAIVVDVSVYGPIERLEEDLEALDGHAWLFVLTRDGLPSDELLDKIETQIRTDSRGRIIGDYVFALAPGDAPFTVEIDIYRDPAFDPVAVQRDVAAAVQSDLDGRAQQLGSSVHRSQLESIALSIDGVLAANCTLIGSEDGTDSIVATRSQWLHATDLTVRIVGDSLP